GAIAVIAPESTRYSDRHSDRRAAAVTSIGALGHHSDRHSDRRAVLIAVIAPDLDGRTKEGGFPTYFQFIISFNFITSLIQSPLLPSILLQSSQNHYYVIRLLLLYYVIHTLITHHHFHCRK
ncbi:hypothetical protein L249_4901, partial [Ophiocordyceps polyrhachis-furcata BCC 54312]